MEYSELLEFLKVKGFDKVLVTGPQRSGTRFTANVLSSDLDVTLVDELDYGINNFNSLMEMISKMDSFVIQGPAVSHHIQNLPPDIFVVFMYRSIGDIFASQTRINWAVAEHTRNYKRFYKEVMGDLEIDWSKSLAEVKYQIWEKYQKPTIKNPNVDLEYSTLKCHDMWKSKQERVKFKANQIK